MNVLTFFLSTYPLGGSNHVTLHPLDRHVHSDTNPSSLGSIQLRYNYLYEDCSLTYPLHVARFTYSFTQLSEQGA